MSIELIPAVGKEEIRKAIADLGGRISSDYRDRRLVCIGTLKGAFIFMADLVRQITIPLEIDFIGASSYEGETSSSGRIRLTKRPDIDLKDKDVLVVEDIVDTGFTLVALIDFLRSFGPKSVKVCSLIDKKERRESEVEIDYSGIVVEKGFLVGYGLDYNEHYRHLPEIYSCKI